MTDSTHTTPTIPHHVLEKLREHPSHHPNVTCLECGYQGMMGIKDRGTRLWAAALWACVLTFWLGWLGLYGIMISPAILGASWVVFARVMAKPMVTCPNCGCDLAIK